MKSLITILLCLITTIAFNQTKVLIGPSMGNKNAISMFADALGADSILVFNVCNDTPHINMQNYQVGGRVFAGLALDTASGSWKGWSPKTKVWSVVGAGTLTSVTSSDITTATVANSTTAPVITIVSAPKFKTARNINGTAFDGTGDITVTAAPSGTAGGDLSGTYPNPSIIGLRGISVPSLASGYLHYNGTSFVWDTPAGGGSGISSIATGLGLAGGPITTSGTLSLDTASAVVLSRQRAATTYIKTVTLNGVTPTLDGAGNVNFGTGFELTAIKVTTLDSSNTNYPSTSAVKKGLFGKVGSVTLNGVTPTLSSAGNVDFGTGFEVTTAKKTVMDSSNTNYPTTGAVKQALAAKLDTASFDQLGAGSHISITNAGDTTKINVADISGLSADNVLANALPALSSGYLHWNGTAWVFDTPSTGLPSLADGKIWVGNGSNIATAITPTGDVTWTNAGITSIGAGKVLNSMLAGSIAYSKLSLTGAILNADLAGSIAYSKLSLSNSIVNADISSSAAIANSKLANSAITINGTSTSLGGTIDLRPVSVTLGSDQTTTSTTMADVTGLSITVPAAGKYILHGITISACSTVNGVKLGINITNATLTTGYLFGNTSSTSTNRLNPVSLINGTSTGNYNTAIGAGTETIDVIFTASAAGVATMRFGSVTGGDTGTISAGSTFILTPLQ